MNKKISLSLLTKDFSHYFEKYGITPKQLKNAYNKTEPVGDFAWSIFNKILSEIALAFKSEAISLESFYEKTSDTYREMAYLLKLEGKDNRKIIGLEFEHRIKYYEIAYADLIGIKIFSVNCCTNCDKFHDKILSISEALEFAKKTEIRCQPLYDSFNKCSIIPETKNDDSLPFKISFSLG